MPKLPDYVWSVVTEASSIRFATPAAAATLPVKTRAPLVISVIKNERSLLPDFFRHYRGLGVERFVIIDNGSVDGCDAYCARQPDADLHYVRRPFLWPQKQGWITRAIEHYGLGRWYIYVDADERLVFDGCERNGLLDLIAVMEAKGVTRVRGMLIDMYQDGPIVDYRWDEPSSLREAFPLFDSDGYCEFKNEQRMSREGGPRQRALSSDTADLKPELTKYPLFKLSRGELMANPHHIVPVESNFVSDCYIGLLHYKFTPGFVTKVKAAVSNKQYWRDSIEYKAYLKALTDQPNLSLRYKGTQTFRNSGDLVKAKMITAVHWGDRAARPLDAMIRKARAAQIERVADNHG